MLKREEKILIDTYKEASRENLPMFAENRVHQRTSGNPYGETRFYRLLWRMVAL